MADQQISVQFTADTSQMNAELQLAINQFNKLKATLSKSTDVSEINKLNTEIGLLSNKINQLGGSVTNTGRAFSSNLKVASNNAAFALTDVNRVVQDLPYGFIGISNNINPLVESFGRLVQSEGGVKNALSSLFSSLAGPVGIAFAFSAVTTALTFASVGLSRWGIASQKAKKDSEDFAKGLRDAQQGAIAQGLKLQALLGIVTDITKTEKERNIALSNANDLLKIHGEKLDSINISQDKVNKTCKAYTDILINQAIAAKLADKIADLTIQKNENLAAQQLQTSKVNAESSARTASATRLIGREYGTSDRAALNYLQTNKNVYDEQNKLNNLQKEGIDIQKQINALTSQYTTSISASNVKSLDGTKSKTETLTDALKKFEKELIAIQATGISLGTPQFNINEDKIKAFESILKKVIEKFNVDPSNKIYLSLEARLNEIQFQQVQQKMKTEFDKIVKDTSNEKVQLGVELDIPPITDFQKQLEELYRQGLIQQAEKLAKENQVPIPINIKFYTPEALNNFIKKLEDLTKNKIDDLNKIVFDYSQQAAAGFGELIGQGIFAAISGQTSGLADAFKGLFTLFGDAVIALGKYAIEYSTAIIALKDAIKKASGSGIAIGIGLIALGVLIKAAAGGIGKAGAFAVGTNYAPGGMALVGERGPELINLPKGSQVVPAAQTSNIMKGAVQQVQVYGVLRGQDIYFSNKKYSQTYNRTT